MPGFVTRDSQGRVTFQLNDRLVRLLRSVTIGAGNRSGSLYIPDGMSGTPFYFCTMGSDPMSAPTGNEVRLQGRTVTWKDVPVGTTIRFGVY